MSQSPQMDVLYMQNLGHVLGIFTRTSEPAQIETDASPFVGDGLHIGGLVNNQDLVIPPGLIGVFRTNRNWRQIFQPLTLYASGLPSAPALMSFPGPTVTAAFTSPNLLITLPTATTGSILVLALDAAGGAPVQFNAQIQAATTAKVAMAGLVSGDKYNAFVFVPTYPIALSTGSFTAP